MAFSGITQQNPLTAFGDLEVAENSARIQLQFAYNVNLAEVSTTVTGSGSVTHSQPFAVCSTTAAASSSAKVASKNNIHYRTGQGGNIFFTAVFTTGVADSTQIVGIGDSVDGLFFGYNGATFGINRRYNSGDNWIAQADWNVDPMTGSGPSGQTLVPTNGNVYRIQYQWLGFGMIKLYIENTNTGSFQLVHQIKYANTSAVTTLLNPSLPLMFEAKNTTNTSNVVVKVPSMAAFVEGKLVNTGLVFSKGVSLSVTTQAAIWTLKCNTTFNSITNKKYIQPLMISLAPTGNIILTYELILNATLGGSPSYTDISTTTSVASFDVAGTTVANGRSLGVFYVNGNNNITIDLSELNLSLNPGDTLTIAGTSSGAASTAGAALTWVEQF